MYFFTYTCNKKKKLSKKYIESEGVHFQKKYIEPIIASTNSHSIF